MHREVKKFFYSLNNDLNKGHDTLLNKRRSNNYSLGLDRLLPPIEVISAYEEIYPGTLEKALEIAQAEQHNRYNLLMKASVMETRWRILGQICSLLSIGFVALAAVKLATLGHIKLAASIVFSHALASFLLALVGLYLNRPNAGFSQNRVHKARHFQDNKKRDFRGSK